MKSKSFVLLAVAALGVAFASESVSEAARYGRGYGGRGYYGARYYGGRGYYSRRGYYPYRYGYGYYPYRYYGSYPSRYGDYAPRSAYPSRSARRAKVVVNAPPGAEVWFAGRKSVKTTSKHVFRTSRISARRHHYTVRARWETADGALVDRSKVVWVRGGQRAAVRFGTPVAYRPAAPRR